MLDLNDIIYGFTRTDSSVFGSAENTSRSGALNTEEHNRNEFRQQVLLGAGVFCFSFGCTFSASGILSFSCYVVGPGDLPKTYRGLSLRFR